MEQYILYSLFHLKNINLPSQPIYSKAFLEKGISDIVKWDVIQIENHQRLKLKFESSNSAWRQGIWLKTNQGLILNDALFPSIELWIDTVPQEVMLECLTSDGLLHLYNIWDQGKGRGSQAWTSGMKIQVTDYQRIYHCNDIGLEAKFDSLVFRLEKV